MFFDENHLHFNNSPTTHLLTLASSKRLETANQGKDQTNGQSKTGAMPSKLRSHRTVHSPLSLLASYCYHFSSHDSYYVSYVLCFSKSQGNEITIP